MSWRAYVVTSVRDLGECDARKQGAACLGFACRVCSFVMMSLVVNGPYPQPSAHHEASACDRPLAPIPWLVGRPAPMEAASHGVARRSRAQASARRWLLSATGPLAARAVARLVQGYPHRWVPAFGRQAKSQWPSSSQRWPSPDAHRPLRASLVCFRQLWT